jgi:hypothetical protein
MKFKVTCRLPRELSLVGTILLIVGALIVGCLIGNVIIGLYGDAIYSFINEHVWVLAPMAGIALWFGIAWITEGYTRESTQKDRDAFVVLAMIMSFFTAGACGLVVAPEPEFPNMLMPGFMYTAVWTLVLIGAFVAGWAAHWCKRCVKIVNESTGAT